MDDFRIWGLNNWKNEVAIYLNGKVKQVKKEISRAFKF